MTIQTRNPFTTETIHEYDLVSSEEAHDFLSRSREAFSIWSDGSASERVGLFREAAFLLRSRIDEYAALITSEMGKPITQSKNEIEKCAWLCEFYAEHAAEFLAPRIEKTGRRASYVAYRPLGPILAVMPWNFPFWQVFRFAVPALAAGNSILLKHSSLTTGCALRIEEFFAEAGFPSGLFQSLVASHETIREVIRSDALAAVSLTGSDRAGREIGAVAASALKKTVLELGGSDPYLVLPDADLDLAVSICVEARLVNGGQSCIAAKRFIVDAEIYENFIWKMKERMESVRMGDPMDATTELGPLAREDLREKLHRQVHESLEQGAECVLGGRMPNGDVGGYFYPPTILTAVEPGMPVFDQEVFGPVAAVSVARDEEEAVRLANSSMYGLGAAVFSRNVAKAERIARDLLDAGVVAVNTQVVSDPRLPFGGVKASGHGRELAWEGIREFVNVKTVMMGPGGR